MSRMEKTALQVVAYLYVVNKIDYVFEVKMIQASEDFIGEMRANGEMLLIGDMVGIHTLSGMDNKNTLYVLMKGWDFSVVSFQERFCSVHRVKVKDVSGETLMMAYIQDFFSTILNAMVCRAKALENYIMEIEDRILKAKQAETMPNQKNRVEIRLSIIGLESSYQTHSKDLKMIENLYNPLLKLHDMIMASMPD